MARKWIREGTKGIKTFKNWTLNIIESINDEIENEDYSEDFKESYNKLKLEFENDPEVNYPEIDEISEFIKDEIIDDLHDSVTQVTGKQSELKDGFPWLSSRYHVLVGGTLLDRGFTVENLILTYMPRDAKKNQEIVSNKGVVFMVTEKNI